jgi:hypothetical protein
MQELDYLRTRNALDLLCLSSNVYPDAKKFMKLDKWRLTEHRVSEIPVVLTSTNSNVSVLAPGQMRSV